MSAFRIGAVVELAWVPLAEGPPPVVHALGTPLADRARGALVRVGRAHYDVRDALSAMADVIGGLEREVQRLQGMMRLAEQGIELHRELAEVGPDGVMLQRSMGLTIGAEGWVVLSLEVRDARQLLVLRAVAHGFDLQFVDPSQEIRDLLVAFTFQQQARERRRQRSASGG